jgi:hypothetical protein
MATGRAKRVATRDAIALVLVTAVGGTLAMACDTVDLGSPPADVNACRPSPRFFYERVWPEFLSRDYGGKHCGDARCHDVGSPRQLRLTMPTSEPVLPLPPDWAAIYRSVTEQLSCTNPSGSNLLNRPGRADHGGGMLITPGGEETALVQMWVAAPP